MKHRKGSKRSTKIHRRRRMHGGDEIETKTEGPGYSCQACTCSKCFELEAHLPDFAGSTPESTASTAPALLPVDNVETLLKTEEVPSEEGLVGGDDESTDEEDQEGGKKRRKRKGRKSKKMRKSSKKGGSKRKRSSRRRKLH